VNGNHNNINIICSSSLLLEAQQQHQQQQRNLKDVTSILLSIWYQLQGEWKKTMEQEEEEAKQCLMKWKVKCCCCGCFFSWFNLSSSTDNVRWRLHFCLRRVLSLRNSSFFWRSWFIYCEMPFNFRQPASNNNKQHAALDGTK